MTSSKEYWVVNISDRNVSLADLNLTIPAFRSMNLLDKRHHKYTWEQLEKSRQQGSIFKKSDKIKLRGSPPEIVKNSVPISFNSTTPTRQRSVMVIEEKTFEELQVLEQKQQEEKYAEENAGLAQKDELDRFINTGLVPPTNLIIEEEVVEKK